MIPHEKTLVKRLEDEPFALVGVNTDGDKDHYLEQADELGVTWRSAWQGSTRGPLPTQWGVTGYPTLYLIDHEGVIRQQWVGDPGGKAIDERVDELVAVARAAAE